MTDADARKNLRHLREAAGVAVEDRRRECVAFPVKRRDRRVEAAQAHRGDVGGREVARLAGGPERGDDAAPPVGGVGLGEAGLGRHHLVRRAPEADEPALGREDPRLHARGADIYPGEQFGHWRRVPAAFAADLPRCPTLEFSTDVPNFSSTFSLLRGR